MTEIVKAFSLSGKHCTLINFLTNPNLICHSALQHFPGKVKTTPGHLLNPITEEYSHRMNIILNNLQNFTKISRKVFFKILHQDLLRQIFNLFLTILIFQKLWEIEEFRNKFLHIVRIVHESLPGGRDGMELSICAVKPAHGDWKTTVNTEGEQQQP